MEKRGVVGVKESSNGKKTKMKREREREREWVLLLEQVKGTAKESIFVWNRYIFKAM